MTNTRVTPEGQALGAQLVRMTEPTIQRLVAEGEPDDRCKTCAFRSGTVPNGCIQTQADAYKAVIESVPFLCHHGERKGSLCHGWYAARVAMRRAEESRGYPFPVKKLPYDFSPPDVD